MINRLGGNFDAIGTYFLFRTLFHDAFAIVPTLIHSIWIVLIASAAVIVELTTTRNLFHVLGGVPEFTAVRQGRLRCQGAFGHPILSGSFGAGFLPIHLLLVGVSQPRSWLAAAGAVGCVVLVIASASSGPVIALASGFAVLSLWPLRGSLRVMRWGAVSILMVLHLIRERPVWHLILRLGQVIGGTGWHRYYLIDAFIRHTNEWWAIGVSTTAHWGFGLQDVTNHW